MLDSFEARAADLVADALNGVAAVQAVTRPRSDLSAAHDRVTIEVRVMTAAPDVNFGDDAAERLGARGQYRLRTTVRLAGQLAISAAIAPSGGPNVADRRRIVMSVVDALLVALQRGSVRSGHDFQTGADLGFDLDGFRFAGLSAPDDAPQSFSTIRALYDFSGRFWPVGVVAEGDAITAVPARIAVLPVQVPLSIHAVAGTDLSVPLKLDLRALNGASARVMARLQGAEPPGQLVGATTDVPAGWTAFTPQPDGSVNIVYRPPVTVATPVRVGVSTALSRAQRPFVALAELTIEVTA